MLFSDNPAPAPNAIQKQRGVDATAHMLGNVLYSKLRIAHIPLVREELSVRGIKYEQKWSIKKLVDLLKQAIIAEQKSSILARTGNTNPSEDELNTKSFLPLSNSANDYKLDG